MSQHPGNVSFGRGDEKVPVVPCYISGSPYQGFPLSPLYTSAKVPVAAAAYGASQVGKSLFMGQVLRPHTEDYCPIGGDETLAEMLEVG